MINIKNTHNFIWLLHIMDQEKVVNYFTTSIDTAVRILNKKNERNWSYMYMYYLLLNCMFEFDLKQFCLEITYLFK